MFNLEAFCCVYEVWLSQKVVYIELMISVKIKCVASKTKAVRVTLSGVIWLDV